MAELKAAKPDLNIEILGVNLIGTDASNGGITAGLTYPWLQDTALEAVWSRWQCVKDDLVIVDSRNHRVTVFNLGQHDLTAGENREALKQLLLRTAVVVDSDSDHLPDDWELQCLGSTTPAPGEDTDGDGRNNFTEFAFGTNPNDPKSAAPLQPGTITTGLPRLGSITFHRRAGSILDYFIETSSDLEHWTLITAAVATAGPPQNLFNGTGTALVRVTLKPATNDLSCGFIRIRAVPRSQ